MTEPWLEDGWPANSVESEILLKNEVIRQQAEIERLRTNEDAAIKYAVAMDEVNDELRTEIERLQAIADTDTPELQQQHEEILQLRAENERLKADLKAITAARQAEQEVLAMEGKLLVRLVLDK